MASKTEIGLVEEYEHFFQRHQPNPKKILEVGVYKGGFLRWLVAEFPTAHVYGIDISPPAMKHARITLARINQVDAPALQKFGNEHGPFDLIIDDASHAKKNTEVTFNALWPFVAKGGWYSIEDWIVGYGAWNKPAFVDMHKVVTGIIERKPKLGISEMRILLRDPRSSMAVFRKA